MPMMPTNLRRKTERGEAETQMERHQRTRKKTRTRKHWRISRGECGLKKNVKRGEGSYDKKRVSTEILLNIIQNRSFMCYLL